MNRTIEAASEKRPSARPQVTLPFEPVHHLALVVNALLDASANAAEMLLLVPPRRAFLLRELVDSNGPGVPNFRGGSDALQTYAFYRRPRVSEERSLIDEASRKTTQ
jgi:hypothetical protein